MATYNISGYQYGLVQYLRLSIWPQYRRLSIYKRYINNNTLKCRAAARHYLDFNYNIDITCIRFRHIHAVVLHNILPYNLII